MDFRLLGTRRSDDRGDPRSVHINERDELLTAQGMPSYAEMTRQGDGWTVQTTDLFAPIAAYPSTLTRLELFNNNPGWTILVADIFAAEVLGTAVQRTTQIFAMVTTKKAAPTLTALVLASLSGRSPITPTTGGPIIPAVDTTVVANGWKPYGHGLNWGLAAATPGPAFSTRLDGMLQVPYECSLCVAPMSLATATSYQCGVTFYWIKQASRLT